MTQAHRPPITSIALLGLVQILVWGGSFFLMAVLASPVIAETGWARQWVYGALSLGILVYGLLAPCSGRLILRYGGRVLLCSSGIITAAGLLVLAMAGSLPVFLLGWAILGVGMAAGLYDALFATLGHVYGPNARSAITGVTLISGFATTVVWPAVAVLIAYCGWRQACCVYAVLLLLLVWPMYAKALPAPGLANAGSGAPPGDSAQVDARLYALLAAIFTLAAVVMTAMSVHLIALLEGRGYSLAGAVSMGALLGPSQVGSRVVDMLARKRHPVWTTCISVSLVLAGLLLIALLPGAAALGVMLYGAGNGLRAIVRGTLPLSLVAAADYPVLMGRMARPALLGQAATPLVGGYLIDAWGAGAAWLVLCGLAVLNLLLVLLLARRLPRWTALPA